MIKHMKTDTDIHLDMWYRYGRGYFDFGLHIDIETNSDKDTNTDIETLDSDIDWISVYVETWTWTKTKIQTIAANFCMNMLPIDVCFQEKSVEFLDDQEGHYSDEAGSVSCKSCDMTAMVVNWRTCQENSRNPRVDLTRYPDIRSGEFQKETLSDSLLWSLISGTAGHWSPDISMAKLPQWQEESQISWCTQVEQTKGLKTFRWEDFFPEKLVGTMWMQNNMWRSFWYSWELQSDPKDCSES